MDTCGNNCTIWAEGLGPPEYLADPDIAGIGVITAFMASCAMTLICAHVGLLFTIPHGLDNDNWIDAKISRSLQASSFFGISSAKKDFWRPVLENLVLSLSDQQIITGLAILITGFIKHCSISVYHFTIVTDLATFSSNAHMTTLNYLQSYLKERPSLRNWRAVLMMILFFALIAASVLGGHWAWYQSWPYQAQCLFDDLIGNVHGSPALWMSVNIIMLLYGYYSGLKGIYPSFSDCIDTWTYEKPLSNMNSGITWLSQRRISNSKNFSSKALQLFYTISWVLLISVRFIFVSLVIILGSSYFTLCFDDMFFGLAIWGILGDRNIPKWDMIGNENEFGFGQIVPLLLLASNILTFRDIYIDQLKEEETKKPGGTTTPLLSPVHTPPSSNLTMNMTGGPGDQHPDDGVELQPQPPRRVDTEAGGRPLARVPEDLNQELHRRSTLPARSPVEVNQRTNTNR